MWQQGVTDDLMVVIDANKVKPDIVNDLSPRIKLLFGITDIKAMIQEIEDGNERLDRFLRPLLSNSKATGGHSFHRSTRFSNGILNSGDSQMACSMPSRMASVIDATRITA